MSAKINTFLKSILKIADNRTAMLPSATTTRNKKKIHCHLRFSTLDTDIADGYLQFLLYIIYMAYFPTMTSCVDLQQESAVRFHKGGHVPSFLVP